MIRSPLRYLGGKFYGRKIIMDNFIPNDCKTIISPFIGGGNLELALASAGVEVLAFDDFEPLINFWTCISNERHKEKVFEEIECTFGSMIHHKAQFMTMKRAYSFYRESSRYRAAAAFFLLNQASFGGASFGNYGFVKQQKITNAINNLIAFKLPESFCIGNGSLSDFRDTLDKFSSTKDGTYFYLDPPYHNCLFSNMYGYAENKNSYKDSFDHEALNEILKSRNGWVLSYNNSEYIKNLYKGYQIYYPEWQYSVNKNNKNIKSNEIIICSHDIKTEFIKVKQVEMFL
jgi:DNA adenine methylase